MFKIAIFNTARIMSHAVLGILAVPAALFGSVGCEEGTDSVAACSANASRLAPELASVPPGTSQLAGNAALLGSGLGPSGRPEYPRGGHCPDMVICTGTTPTESGYREINIDYTGALERESRLDFLLTVEQRDTLLAADVESLLLVSVEFRDTGMQPAAELLLFVEPGAMSQAIRLVAVYEQPGLAPVSSMLTVGKDGAFPVSVVLQSGANDAQASIVVDGTPLIQRTATLRPAMLRYGKLGAIYGTPPQTSAVALVLGDWQVNVGELRLPPTFGFAPQ